MERRWGSRVRYGLDTISVLLTIAVCVMLLWRGGLPASPERAAKLPNRAGASELLPKDPVAIEGAPSKGNPTAPVVLIMFSDFECPFCEKFANGTWPDLDKQYVQTGKAFVVFRYLPLGIHPHARAAAHAAECAGQQGQFWQMHDSLFASQANLDDLSLSRRAAVLGLDMKIFNNCLSGPADRVDEGLKQASALGVVGTPTFLIGRRQADGRVKVSQRLSGAKPMDAFRAALNVVITAASVGG